MKFAVILAIFLSLWSRFNQIADENRLQKEAEAAYSLKKYSQSVMKYNSLINTYNNSDEHIRMNLAHSFYFLQDSVNAEFHYNKLSRSVNPDINSVSNHQLGMISAANNDYHRALKYFRQALKADPGNEAARYNYELIKKKLEEKNKKKSGEEDKSKQNKTNDQGEMIENDDSPSGGKGKTGARGEQGKSGQIQKSMEDSEGNQEKSKGDGEKSKARDQSVKGNEEQQMNELKPEENGKNRREALISQRLKLMHMSEERAKMILDAMKNSEIQYLQQIKKKGNPKYDNAKPSW